MTVKVLTSKFERFEGTVAGDVAVPWYAGGSGCYGSAVPAQSFG